MEIKNTYQFTSSVATSVVVVLVVDDVVQNSLTLVLEVVMQSKTRSLLVADFTSPTC